MHSRTLGYVRPVHPRIRYLWFRLEVEFGRLSENTEEVGESDAHGHPGCLPQRQGNVDYSLLGRLLKIYKIEPSGFSSTKLLAELIKDTEELYTIHFGEHRVPHPNPTTDARTGSQPGVTRREHLVTFALAGNRRPTTFPRTELAYI